MLDILLTALSHHATLPTFKPSGDVRPPAACCAPHLDSEFYISSAPALIGQLARIITRQRSSALTPAESSEGLRLAYLATRTLHHIVADFFNSPGFHTSLQLSSKGDSYVPGLLAGLLRVAGGDLPPALVNTDLCPLEKPFPLQRLSVD